MKSIIKPALVFSMGSRGFGRNCLACLCVICVAGCLDTTNELPGSTDGGDGSTDAASVDVTSSDAASADAASADVAREDAAAAADVQVCPEGTCGGTCGACASVQQYCGVDQLCVPCTAGAIEIFPKKVGVFTTVMRQQFVAFAVQANGSKLNITTQINWQSSDPSLVTVDANGLATVVPGVSSGKVNITTPCGPTSTSLTIVHVTDYNTLDNSVTQWPTWPTGPDVQYPLDAPSLPPAGHGVYLYDYVETSTRITWETHPHSTPYMAGGNGLNSMLCSVWSTDGGETFRLSSWDYLAPTTHEKRVSGGDECWVGIMVHSFWDLERNRTNLYFSVVPVAPAQHPDPSTCWATR